MSDQTAFLLAMSTGPMLRGDAIVVLCGEDGQARADVGLQLFAQRGGETLVLSGGRHEPPLILGADHLREGLIARGVAPTKIRVDTVSQNTREQAERVIGMAVEEGWGRLLLVASSYHLPRALLTFVAALNGRAESIHVVPIGATQAPWFQPPPGGERSRLELWEGESAKITRYRAAGDCATYEQGLAYLQHWEGKTWK